MDKQIVKSQADFSSFFKAVFDHQYLEVFGQDRASVDSKKEDFTLLISQNQEILAAVQCSSLYETLKVHNFGVAPSCQGQGLGRELMDEIKAYAEKEGIYNLVLTTRSYQARDFYLKQGFEEFGYLADMPFKSVGTSYMIYRFK